MGYDEAYDVEKRAQSTTAEGLTKHHGKLMTEDGAVPGDTFEIGDSWYAKTQRLAGRLKIEQRGIERVPEDEREDSGFKALLNTMTMVGGRSWTTKDDNMLMKFCSGSPPIWSCPPSPLAYSDAQSGTWAWRTLC